MPLRLTDTQLHHVMAAAGSLAIEKRDTFLQRVAGRLARIRRPSDQDVAAAVATALRGLVQEPAA